MSRDLPPIQDQARGLSIRRQLVDVVLDALLASAAIVLGWFAGHRHPARPSADLEVSSQSKRPGQVFSPTPEQWATITAEPVQSQVFRAERVTEGKLAVDEDRSTPIFSPYSGRVTRLQASPGDVVERGQPLFVVEATDMLQAQNDFITASTAMNKARSQLNLAQIVEKRNRDLYQGRAVPLKDFQQAQADLTTAENDARSAETALEAARNRLRIFGKTDAEISAFQERGTISASTTIYAPIGGTVVQRKVGPGQYINNSSSDPVFVIGDLSTVWLLAYVRETDAPNVEVGQPLRFTVLAFPERVYEAKITYVAAALDPGTRRLLVRATIDNPDRQLKPEMFATVTILTGSGETSPAVPREAVIYEGENARVWVVRDDKTIELRQIRTGLTSGRMIQVIEGLKPDQRVVTKGSLFIDRAAVGT